MKIRKHAQTLNFLKNLNKSSEGISSTQRKMASGLRVNSAKDDAASLSISEKTKAMIGSKYMARRNANDGMSVFQIAEGALEVFQDSLIRVRELAIQASSDTVSDREREMIDIERSQLLTELNRVAQKTSFNGKKLFDGSTLEFDLFVDGLSSNKSRMRVDFSDMLQTPLALGVAQIKFNSKFNASLSLNPIDNAINEISSSRAKLGAVMQSLESQVSKLSQDYESLNSANSTRVDTDYAEVTSENVKEKIKRESQLSSFSNFNSSRSHLLKLLS